MVTDLQHRIFMARQAAQQHHHNDAGAGRRQCHRQEGEKLSPCPEASSKKLLTIKLVEVPIRSGSRPEWPRKTEAKSN